MDVNEQLENSTSRIGLYRNFNLKKRSLFAVELSNFWVENPVFHQLVLMHSDIEGIRKKVFNYLAEFERRTLSGHCNMNSNDRNIARKCIHVLKNIFSKRSEELTGFSALEAMVRLAHHLDEEIDLSFIREFRCLFLGMKGNTDISAKVKSLDFTGNNSETNGGVRSEVLNFVAEQMKTRMARFKSGLEEEIIYQRQENTKRIMEYFGAGPEEWNDWGWQIRYTVKDAETLGNLIKLNTRERAAIEKAWAGKLPFGITPYYVSLMDRLPNRTHDHAIRAQVIPPLDYVEQVLKNKEIGLDMDFMGEKETSPVELVTRRYPKIAILKPFNTCAQICVYCQRNWEINDVLSEQAEASKNKLDNALDWCEQNTALEEVLVTGGDPGIMTDSVLKKILTRLKGMNHIKRIRLGTRIPVVLPMRVTEEFADLLASFIEPGRREVVIMTHFEHPYEVTPDSMQAVQRLKSKGISVYNQTVFTVENSRRFEMVSLRRTLRMIGVDPYYTFNTKGKEETRAYRVPIARLIQEQVEEARLTPGLDRTDEAVFNIPRIGKSYLRAGQDHEVIMVLPNGARVYEFFPWDHSFLDTKPYLYEDVSINDYLAEMAKRGEDPADYKSIWYHF